MRYQAQHGNEPTTEQLSAYLAAQGLFRQGSKPISPANLRRHFLRWRIYNICATYRVHTETTSLNGIVHEYTTHDITAQYNQPVTTRYITQATTQFEQRWRTLADTQR